MKGLWKYLSPFAPDQSGACAVLYDLGGIIIICDAGGCAGNVCGFDEPRWFTDRSAIFSAGLRDMDAVFGRDEQLVDKLISAYDDLGGEAEFAAIVGTPVPAVIGTDYFALKRLAKKKSGLTIITVDTNGMELYDEGAAKAYMSIVEEFALDIDEAKDLLMRAGMTFSKHYPTDRLVEEHIRSHHYDIDEINYILYEMDLMGLGYSRGGD